MKGRLLKGISTAVMLGGVVLCLISLVRMQQQESVRWILTPLTLLGACTAMLVALLSMVLAWRLHLRALTRQTLTLKQALRQVAAMLVGKYVPVLIGGVLVRVAQNAERIRASIVVAACVFEQCGAIGAAVAIGIVLYFSVSAAFVLPLVFIATLVIIPFAPLLLGATWQLLMRWKSQGDELPGIDLFLSARDLRCALGWQIVQWIALAGLVAMIAGMVVPHLSPMELSLVSGAYALAVAAGIAAVFIPGGLGVREAAFIGLCAGALDTHEALQLALALRIAMSVFDALAYSFDLAVRGIDRGGDFR